MLVYNLKEKSSRHQQSKSFVGRNKLESRLGLELRGRQSSKKLSFSTPGILIALIFFRQIKISPFRHCVARDSSLPWMTSTESVVPDGKCIAADT